MYFKSLEIVGFKSFKNRTKLKFEPGVTAVVGPNGCGKSNIVDAIKWVLGDQSAKSMRSSVMQDVIFNGTEKHEAVNVAEVSLTLSNEDKSLPVDYDEVTVTRRLYRDGESEYLLNKNLVRLADIRSLLMGTGIGTSAYSIVEQGRMDMVLSSRPEDRRYLFEEASGITRFKTKKREALLKLEKTQENLVRIKDIVNEVERQIKSIERQARKAERYKERFEELKDLEVKFSFKELKELTTNDSNVGEENAKLKSVAEKLSSELQTATDQISTFREEYNEILEKLQHTQNEVVRLSSDIDKNKHTVEISGERILEFEKSVERIDWEIEESTERKDLLKSRVADLQARFAVVTEKSKAKKEELEKAEKNVQETNEFIEQHRHEVKINREKTIDLITEQTKAKNASIKSEANIHNALNRKKRLMLEKTSVQAENERIRRDLDRVEQETDIANKELEGTRRDFEDFSGKYQENQQKLSGIKNGKEEKQRRLNEIRPRRQFLEKLISEREGIKSSVKEIMSKIEEQDSQFSGVHGILSELISVQDGYGESIETILGDASQALVVENIGIAENVIRYLEERKMESVNFVILDELNARLMEGNIREQLSSMENITSILMAKEPYLSALRALLNDIYVAVSGEEANRLIKERADFSGRIITKKGAVYQKGLRRSSNFSDKEVITLFGRREKVEHMLAEEKRLQEKIDSFLTEINDLVRWLSESEIKKKKIESALHEKQMQYADISSKRNSIKERSGALSQEMIVLDVEVKEEEEIVRQLEEEKKTAEMKLEQLTVEYNKLQEVIESSQIFIQESNIKREQALFFMSDIKAELSGLIKEEENLSDNLEREKASFDRIGREVEGKRTRITESGERIRKFKEDIGNIAVQNEEFQVKLEVMSGDKNEIQEEKNRIAETIEIESIQIRKMENELEASRNKSRDIDIVKKELEYKRDALIEKVRSAYKVNVNSLNIELEENIDWDWIVARIDELKNQLDKMGEVSLGAVEEHKQLEERFVFLTKQRDDLVESREQLMSAIVRINRTTKKMFLETFEKIQKEFRDYFRMLFNGGKADIVLQDESNVLECGIDIIVRPPGKKVHNIMQLSGGEKAMTAIALIFALFKVNPSPFCVLDEVDAPLDESNIVRFCNVLQEFLKLSQFIIITHNRMTIQLADVLYGVTMQEKGVSKIVSVKLTDETETFKEDAMPVGA